MKRVIKFRAYTEISNEVLGMKYDVPHDYNDTVMQFTGLLDCNGKEIYEGDILSGGFTSMKGTHKEQYIPYKDVVSWEEICDSYVDRQSYVGYEKSRWENMEIIGNIYQNPELIK